MHKFCAKPAPAGSRHCLREAGHDGACAYDCGCGAGDRCGDPLHCDLSRAFAPAIYGDGTAQGNDDDDDDEPEGCSHCRGTGIGMWGDPNTSRCSSCGGTGVSRA